MLVEEKKPERMKDFLAACLEQPGKIKRIIVETEPTFERSKLRALLRNDRWPVAFNPVLLVANDQDKTDRADTILDLLLEVGMVVQDKKFLDFGCGEGHIAHHAGHRARLAVGYDIDETGWSQFRASDRFLLTSEFQEVHRHGPYDVIMLYDVLDHVIEEDPTDILKDLRSILKDDGKIYVRCHPWCSKHGTHTYKTMNKAYLHFFFTPEELAGMGVPSLPTRKIIHPITTYDDWFSKAGFKKVDSQSNVIRSDVDPFFTQEDVLATIIKDHWKDSYEERLSSGKVFPKHQLEQEFLDFVLVKDKTTSS